VTPAPRRVADNAARAGTAGGASARTRRLPGLALLVVVLLPGVLGGCAHAADAVGTRSATRVPSGLATALSSASPEPGGSADPVSRLRGALLGPGDLGPGWRRGAPPVPDPSTPAPCGGPSTVARFPDALRVGSTVDGPAGGVVQEALSVYGDADTAQAAFRAGLAGLECGQGTLHGAPVTIAPVQDRRTDLGGDRASSWQVGSDTVDAVLVMVQAREAVFSFAYVMQPGAAAAARLDPLALSRAAVARALAA
jgi:hypothetical protein